MPTEGVSFRCYAVSTRPSLLQRRGPLASQRHKMRLPVFEILHALVVARLVLRQFGDVGHVELNLEGLEFSPFRVNPSLRFAILGLPHIELRSNKLLESSEPHLHLALGRTYRSLESFHAEENG